MNNSDIGCNNTYNRKETFSYKTISKQQAQSLCNQQSNFCKLYANIEGCKVADGSQNGGLLLRNVCKVFNDKKFVLQNEWSKMIFKIREYTKRSSTIVGNAKGLDVGFTQLVENEGTLETPVRFSIRDKNQWQASISYVTITNLNSCRWPLFYIIAVLVENEYYTENRMQMLLSLTSECEKCPINEARKKFIQRGFSFILCNGDCRRFPKIWDQVYITLIAFTLRRNIKTHKMIING